MARRSTGLVGQGKVLASSLAHRLTGFSIPIFGVQWTPPADEREIVRRLMTELEDRRALFAPYSLEVPSEVTSSVMRIRGLLTATLQELSEGSAAADSLRAMRAGCRRFLDGPRAEFRNLYPHHMRGIDRDEFDAGFFTALGELRATMGMHVAALAVRYGIDIEGDLATVLPSVDEP